MTTLTHRKKRDYYSFVSTLFLPKGLDGKAFSIKESWLPFSGDNQQLILLYKHRLPEVFPALNEKSYAAIGPSLDFYAIKKDVDIQSNLFRFRPHAFEAYEADGEDLSITGLTPKIRESDLENRIIIETHNQAESIRVLNELLIIIENALSDEQINVPSAIDNMKLRNRVSHLLSTYPFLPFVIFKQLPKLSVLYLSGFINDVKTVYAFIRPKKGEISIDETWIANEHKVKVVEA